MAGESAALPLAPERLVGLRAEDMGGGSEQSALSGLWRYVFALCARQAASAHGNYLASGVRRCPELHQVCHFHSDRKQTETTGS